MVRSLAGQVITWIACQLLSLEFQTDPTLLTAGAVMTVLLGTVFSAKPALRAAQLDPVKALASE